MNQVVVLMSTFNGKKFLCEQIESILNQKKVEVKLFVRDDGSQDSTVKIIKSYHDSRISVYKGSNVGAANSFLKLIKDAPTAEFYAYSDQDDVWNENKLYEAIIKMKKCSRKEPILYMSTYDVVDETLHFISKRNMKFDIPFSLESTIVERSPSGCTMVFNDILMQILKKGHPNFIRMHDYWTLLVTEAFHGNIVVDNCSMLKYRQHANNAVGINKGRFTNFKRLWNSALYGENERQKQAVSVLEEYAGNLPQESMDSLIKIKNYKKTLHHRITLAKDKRFRTDSRKTNILFIVSVILGLF